jgi:hypothetical protein
MKRRLGLAIVMLTTMALIIGVVGVATVSASKKKGSEGCTPGYWKQAQHFDSWTAPYDPTDLFSATVGTRADASTTTFEDAFPGMTLLQVLEQSGGGLAALGRHTVAALLNTASADVDYAHTTTGFIVDEFNSVFPNGDYEGLKNIYAGFNELGCPLN